jgi:hypothetical protein
MFREHIKGAGKHVEKEKEKEKEAESFWELAVLHEDLVCSS